MRTSALTRRGLESALVFKFGIRVTPMISKQQLREYLWAVGFMPTEGMLIVDELYVFPSEKWVRQTFLPAWTEYKKNLDQVGISMRWKAEVKDCDDFAAKMSDYAKDLHAHTEAELGRRGRPYRDAKAALCFGWMAYVRDRDGEGHAINFTIVEGHDGQPELLFFDGGLDAVVSLNRKEIESCFGLYV
jgi:hypothetical protein